MTHCPRCRSEIKTSGTQYGHILGCGAVETCSDAHTPYDTGDRTSPYDETVQVGILQAALEKSGLPGDKETARRLAGELREALQKLPPPYP
jgi:hypothetical protein